MSIILSKQLRNRQILTGDVSAPEPRTDLDWQDDALCAQVALDIFFPERGGSTRQAKSICAECTVSEQCLSYALELDERFGVWGGLSERERRKLQPRTLDGSARPKKGAETLTKVIALHKLGQTDAEISAAIGVTVRHVYRIRVQQGLESNVPKRDAA